MERRKNPLFNQSLEKGLALLCAFGGHKKTMTISELAQASGMNKSSAQRMTYTLESLGYIEKYPRTGRFRLTVRVLQLGLNYLYANALIDMANPFLSELSNMTGETACLTEPDDGEMVYVSRFVSASFVPVHMPIGSRIPMYCTSAGRAYLSALTDEQCQEILQKQDRVKHTVHTKYKLPDIMSELQAARRRGYAVNTEELFLGDMTLGAPVINSQGHPIAAVHIVAPTGRWDLRRARTKLAPVLVSTARSLSNAVRGLE